MQLEPRNRSFCDADPLGGVDHVRRDHQVVVEELGGLGGHWRGCRRPGRRRPPRPRAAPRPSSARPRLPAQIALLARDRQDRAALALEPAHQRAADHAAVPGDPHPLAGERIEPAMAPLRAAHRMPRSCAQAALAAFAPDLAQIGLDHLAHQLGEARCDGASRAARAPCSGSPSSRSTSVGRK